MVAVVALLLVVMIAAVLLALAVFLKLINRLVVVGVVGLWWGCGSAYGDVVMVRWWQWWPYCWW